MKKMRRVAHWLFMTAFLLLSGTAQAARQVDETRPAAADGRVNISNLAGSVAVRGWDRNEVHVSGTLAEQVERLDIQAEDGSVRIQVVVPERVRDLDGTDLQVRVPSGSRLTVETVSAGIDIQDAHGAVEAESVSGDISIASRAARISATSISGTLEIKGGGEDAELELATISGGIRTQDATGRIEAETVSGSMIIRGTAIRGFEGETTSGGIRYEAGLLPGGRYDFASISGGVELRLAGEIDARFEIIAFSGGIDSEFGPEPQRSSEYGPGRELRFTQGRGAAQVSIETLSGNIEIRRR